MNGVRLHFALAGAPAAPPLVLIHGSWGDRHNWDAVVSGFSQSFRVVIYDRRGHTDSGPAPVPGSITDDVQDAASLIEHLGIGPAHIVGSSFGASIVLKLALTRPELFRTLTAHEPPLTGLLGGDGVGSEVLASLAAVGSKLQGGDIEGGARQFVEEVAFGPGAWDGMSEANRRKFMSNAPTFLDEFSEPGAYELNVPALGRFTQPALLTEGDRSHPFFRPILDQLAAALPAARRHTFTGAGHVPHLTHPAEFVKTISEFAMPGPKGPGLL